MEKPKTLDEAIYRAKHYDEILQAEAKVRNANNKPIEMTYMPEFSDYDTCPACNTKFDIKKAYIGDSSCPACGQPLDISAFYT